MNINPNIRIVRFPYRSSADLVRHDMGFEYTTRCGHTHVANKRREQQAQARYLRSLRGLALGVNIGPGV